MGMSQEAIVKNIRLSSQHAERLAQLAQVRQLDESLVVEKALEILFSLTDLYDPSDEDMIWSSLSEPSLHRIWDNEEDARYDNWRELYGV
jgi:hypothetical protein